jgi:hypothetical protein
LQKKSFVQSEIKCEINFIQSVDVGCSTAFQILILKKVPTGRIFVEQTMSTGLVDDNEGNRWPEEMQSKLVAEWFFDAELITEFYATRASRFAIMAWLIPFHGCLFIGPVACAGACTARKNNWERSSSMRVGLTQDELVFQVGRFGGLCRCKCQETGAVSTIVPLKRITDIRVELPAGGCCPPNVLTKVHVQTAGQGGPSEIQLEGLFDADHFRRSLLAWRAGESIPQPKSSQSAKIYSSKPHAKTAVAAAAAAKAADELEMENSSTGKKGSGSRHADHISPSSGGDTPAQLESVDLLREVKAEMKAINDNLAAMRAMMEKNGGSL